MNVMLLLPTDRMLTPLPVPTPRGLPLCCATTFCPFFLRLQITYLAPIAMQAMSFSPHHPPYLVHI